MSRSDFQIGDRIGAYELVAHVGSGGFASVWRARRKGPGGFEVQVALKLTRTSLASDPQFEIMFIDEAKVAALIDHPNVVKIFELGTERETLFMAMEYVRGKPLSALRNMAEREGRRIPVEIVMRILADTCAGLHAAHELARDGKPLEVIHRDVSPENILVSDTGVVKLIDFGIAKAQDRLSTDTANGIAKGKLRYMAPEQAMAKVLDRRADIWAVGAVGFDVLMGRPVFDAPNDVARLMALVGNNPVPPLDPTIPRPYAQIIERALARRPEDRYPTAAAMRADIERALADNSATVGSDALVELFGPWLRLNDEDLSEEDSRAILRARLAGDRHADETTDLGKLGSADTIDSPHVETLGAVNSSLDVGNRGPSWRLSLIAVATVALAVGVVAWLGMREPRATALPSATATSLASAHAPPRSSETATASAPAPEPAPLDVDGGHPRTAATASTATAATTTAASPAKRRMSPAPKKPSKPVSSTRPRYDDTIQ